MSDQLWTIGHSTRSLEEFLALLDAHRIQHLVDVRRYPFSRRYPHFNGVLLAASLRNADVAYTHVPGLGGRRKPRPASVNLGWRNDSFRGYADYIQTDEFQSALEKLIAESRRRPTAIMCAEAVPWHCHRSLIADTLLLRHWTVTHILSRTKTDGHRMTWFAVAQDGIVTYPARTDPDRAPTLF